MHEEYVQEPDASDDQQKQIDDLVDQGVMNYHDAREFIMGRKKQKPEPNTIAETLDEYWKRIDDEAIEKGTRPTHEERERQLSYAKMAREAFRQSLKDNRSK